MDVAQHWAIRFAVEGDVRFLSHHDLMRAVERAALRAKLPLRFSQGFNPRPAVSLPCPRPVGVASLDELAVLAMDDSAPPLEALPVAASLNAAGPRGLRFTRAEPIDRRMLHPVRIEYELPLEPGASDGLQARRIELQAMERWTVQRDSGQDKALREIDLKPLLAGMEIRPGSLRWSQVPQGQSWARPGEVLALLGLDAQVDLARVVRRAVQYE